MKKFFVSHMVPSDSEVGKKNFNLRLLVIICLIGSTVVAGYFPFAFFKILEYTLAMQEYRAVVQQTETSFQTGISNKIESLRTVDTNMRSTCPLASTWPNCSLTRSGDI